jgi:hypothetical protein
MREVNGIVLADHADSDRALHVVSGSSQELRQEYAGAVVVEVEPHKLFCLTLSSVVSTFGWPS